MRTFDDIVSIYDDIVSVHDIPATRIRGIWISLINRLRYKVVTSGESSDLINRFKDEFSIFLDVQFFEIRLRGILKFIRETRQKNAREEDTKEKTPPLYF